MADFESDLQIDGKSVYSLRVVDLKQELKKKDIVFKTNASKAQLQALLIDHLKQTIDTIDTIDDKSSEDNSRMTIQSEDTNETIDSNNVHSFEDNRNEEQSEVTDLSQDSGITSSVSFGDKNSIKLKIKLPTNDSPNRQLSPKKSPIKEMRSPIVYEESKIVEEVVKPIVEDNSFVAKVVQQVNQQFAEDLSQKHSKSEKSDELKPILNADIIEQKTDINEDTIKNNVKEVVTKHVIVEEVIAKKDNVEEVVTKEDTEDSVGEVPKQMIVEMSKERNVEEVSKVDNAEEVTQQSTQHKDCESEEVIPKTQDINQLVVKDKKKNEIKEQINETLISNTISEKDSKVLTKTISEVKTKESTEESIVEKSVEKTQKISEKENKSLESEPKAEKPKPPRRRRWGGSVANDVQQNQIKGISSDQLKDLIPDLDSTASGADNTSTSKVSKSEASNSSLVITSSQLRTQTTDAINEMPAKRDIRVVRKSVSVPEEGQTSAEETVRHQRPPIVEQKQKIIVEFENKSEEPLEVTREMSPALNPESTVIFIRNLVRPFTLLQLKEVLGKTGKLIEERFWIDKIKSKCYVTYNTVEEAVATRLTLHGTQWPASNPKRLCVDFSTKEELDSHLSEEIVIKRIDKNNDGNGNVVQKYDIVIKSDDKRDKENKAEIRPIREWDREKLVPKEEDRRNVKRRPNSPSQRDRSHESDAKRRRQEPIKGEERVRPADSTSGEIPTAAAAQESGESPAKLLDDLFRKTTATPSIYWLPLTEEQVVARDAFRAEEDKRRQEERNAREEQFRKRAEERRDSPNRFERNQRRIDSPPPFRRNFGRPPPRRSPPRHRSPPPGRFSRSPINRRKR